ncbi:MAG: adenylosuccinate synthetase [Candidatus Woesearchaeota archaeon]|nr:adenylosuccinate synthetase [Candidatus Woesearchaeota archaeon]
MPNTIVVGLQWGDEGKAKILDDLVQEAKQANDKKIWVVRFQGGPNAGHTNYILMPDGRLVKFVSHAAPIGVTSNSEIGIGPNVAFDPEKFIKEVEEARKLFGYNAGIHISERTGILFDYHRKLDAWQESLRTGNLKIGTTVSGIGPFYMDNANRATRITFAEYVSDNFHDTLAKVLEQKSHELVAARIPGLVTGKYLDTLIATHDPIRKELKECACELEYILREALEKGENIILEGAQGSMLDIDMGTKPTQTSSHLLATDPLAGLGLPRSAFRIYGVEKLYPTRVGEGVMPTLAEDNFGIETQKNAGEVGASTGRDRRVGYPDWVIIKYTAMLNDIDGIYLTRVDNVQDRDIKVCTAYEVNGKRTERVPSKLETATPIYSDKIYSWHLWDGPADLSKPEEVDKALHDKRADYVKEGSGSLPKSLKEYIIDHENYIKKPIIGMSIGPARGEIVKL